MEFLELNLIERNPFQPRKEFAPEELHDLARSIKEFGIIQPLVVRPMGEKYQLIAGERRFRAATLLEMDRVPVIVAECSDQASAALALIENIQRQDLSPLEEAQGYLVLQQNFALRQEDIARKVGKSRSHVANVLRLLKLAPGVQRLLLQKELSMGQAKPLLAVEDDKEQLNLAHKVIKEQMTARQVEQMLKKSQNKPLAPGVNVDPEGEYTKEYQAYLEEILQRRLGTEVKLKMGEKKSTMEITFFNQDDLERLVDLLDPPEKAREEGAEIKNFCI